MLPSVIAKYWNLTVQTLLMMPVALQGNAFEMTLIKDFLHDESGATAIEYGLIAGLISVIMIAVLTNVGTKLNAKFGRISNALN